MKRADRRTEKIIKRIMKSAKKEMLILLKDNSKDYHLDKEEISNLFLNRGVKVIIVAGPDVVLGPEIKELLGDKIVFLKKPPRTSSFLADGKNILVEKRKRKVFYKFCSPIDGLRARQEFLEVIGDDLAAYLGLISFSLFERYIVFSCFYQISTG